MDMPGEAADLAGVDATDDVRADEAVDGAANGVSNQLQRLLTACGQTRVDSWSAALGDNGNLHKFTDFNVEVRECGAGRSTDKSAGRLKAEILSVTV